MSAPKKILLIDDEPTVLSALKLVLKVLGHAVEEFDKPQAALSRLQSGALFDLILCDLKMPVMNGLQFLQESKQVAPQIPFVLMSGHALADDVAKARELGAVDFLGKPFTPGQLGDLFGRLDAGTFKP